MWPFGSTGACLWAAGNSAPALLPAPTGGAYGFEKGILVGPALFGLVGFRILLFPCPADSDPLAGSSSANAQFAAATHAAPIKMRPVRPIPADPASCAARPAERRDRPASLTPPGLEVPTESAG